METKVLGTRIPFSSTNVFWRDSEFCPQGVWGNAGNSKLKMQNSISISCLRSSYHIVSSLKKIPSSASASDISARATSAESRWRAFCLWTAQMAGNEPFKQNQPASCGERKCSSPQRLRLPLFSFSIYFLWCRFRFEILYCNSTRHSSFSRGHPSRNVRRRNAEIQMRLTHPPVRAQNRRGKKGAAAPRKVNLKPWVKLTFYFFLR